MLCEPTYHTIPLQRVKNAKYDEGGGMGGKRCWKAIKGAGKAMSGGALSVLWVGSDICNSRKEVNKEKNRIKAGTEKIQSGELTKTFLDLGKTLISSNTHPNVFIKA
jgi:hypothetical protein